jgi:threonine/homoserine/homoserine lactone efflux protein
MNWSGFYALALFAAVYPVLLAVVALMLPTERPTVLLAGLLTGGFLTTLIFGVVVVSVVGSTDALTSSNHNTVRAIVNIVIAAVLLAAAAKIFFFPDLKLGRHRGESAVKSGEANEAKKDGSSSGWAARAKRANSFWAAFVVGVAIDLPSVWFLAALKYLIDAEFSAAVVFVLLVSYALIAYISIELSLLFNIKWPVQTRRVVETANNWVKAHQKVIAGGIAAGIGIWQLSVGISKLA